MSRFAGSSQSFLLELTLPGTVLGTRWSLEVFFILVHETELKGLLLKQSA